MSRPIALFVVAVSFFFSSVAFAQFFQGPAQGSIPVGVTVTTDVYSSSPAVIFNRRRPIKNKARRQFPAEFTTQLAKMPSEIEILRELPRAEPPQAGKTATLLLRNFAGIPETNSIPPDPYLAVGPRHIVGTVNSRFAIWDKEGRKLKDIDAAMWFRTPALNVDPFDPKVIYDHFAKRWVMVWLDVNTSEKKAYYLLSVSDDEDPLGNWNNYAMLSNLVGSTDQVLWGDYQGVGFDAQAIYITSNQFGFDENDSRFSNRIRIIPKEDLYRAEPGQVRWTDFWDVGSSPTSSFAAYTIRPTLMYDNSNSYYFLFAPSGGGNFVALYTLTNPVTNPSLSVQRITVTQYQSAPNANQLGGSSILLENSGSSLRYEPVVRGGMLYAVFAVGLPNATQFSAMRYLKINAVARTLAEQFTAGNQGAWIMYPTIAVDKYGTVAVGYSRSSTTEYVGAYYSTRLDGEPAGFSVTGILKLGNANYVKDFGSGRNRWGDYNGIWLDPDNEEHFWMMTEYVERQNTWGTSIGEIRASPFIGPTSYALTPSVQFNPTEKMTVSETRDAIISNFGTDTVRIDALPSAVGKFTVVSAPPLPIIIPPYDTIRISLRFDPIATGLVTDTLRWLSSNDIGFRGVELRGRGYEINPASKDQWYVSGGLTAQGRLYGLNTATAGLSAFGPSNYTELNSIAINPRTGVIVATHQPATESAPVLVRINATLGDAYQLARLPAVRIVSLAFDTTGTLFGATRTGGIYRYEEGSKSLTRVDSVRTQLSSIAFHPRTNELWGSAYAVIGTARENIFRIRLGTGDTVMVGKTGLTLNINDLEFDVFGQLYGVRGTTSVANDLVAIDTETGKGLVVGSMNIPNITGIATGLGLITSVPQREDRAIPATFTLAQNYPNPFNPTTVIRFTVPERSSISLSVYDALGKRIAVLAESDLSAGSYSVAWNGNGESGPAASGIYFYSLEAAGFSGAIFKQTKKMMLLK